MGKPLIRDSERGQALLEYWPLIPGSIILPAFLMGKFLSSMIGDAFNDVVTNLRCNRGIGNGSELCDPGNSGGQGGGYGREAGEDEPERHCTPDVCWELDPAIVDQGTVYIENVCDAFIVPPNGTITIYEDRVEWDGDSLNRVELWYCQE